MKCPNCNNKIKTLEVTCSPFEVKFLVENIGDKLEIASGLTISENFSVYDVNNKDKNFGTICPKCSIKLYLSDMIVGISCYKCGISLENKEDYWCSKVSRTYCREHAGTYLGKSCITCPIRTTCKLGKSVIKLIGDNQ